MEKKIPLSFKSIWDELPYLDFFNHKEKLPYWEKYSFETLELIHKNMNVGLVGETGIGKTIIAILISLFFKKVIILSPTKILTNQHKELYDRITGKESSIVINGTINAKKRNWRDNNIHFISATPQTFLKDIKNNIVKITNFNLIIFDEFDMANGAYSYVHIAKLCQEYRIPNLGLTASPGDSIAKIEEKKLIYHFDKLIPLRLPIPTKSYHKVEVKMTNLLEETIETLQNLMGKSLIELDRYVPSSYELFCKNGNYLSENNLISIKNIIRLLPRKLLGHASSLLAEYYKLSYSSRIITGESYFTFLEYVKKLKKEAVPQKINKNFASERIIWNKDFRDISNNIHRENLKNLHPKVKALLIEINNIPDDQGIIFVENKITAKYIELFLNSNGIKSSMITGGKTGNNKKANLILDLFQKKEIRFLVATSVIERGWSIPYIESVIHYTLPLTGISLLQRNGRAGRFKPGRVIYLVSNTRYENTLFFIANKKCNTMKNIVYEGKIPQIKKNKINKLSLQYKLDL